jgi:hypothetical protein
LKSTPEEEEEEELKSRGRRTREGLRSERENMEKNIIEDLEKKMLEKEREFMETSEHLRREAAVKENEALRAQQMLNQEKKNYRERAMIANHQRVTEIDRLNAQNEKTVNELQQEILELKNTIQNSREHVENREKFDTEYMKVSEELKRAKLKIENVDEEREEAIATITAKMQNELEENVKKATKECELAVEGKLEANVRKIFAHNRTMADAFKIHVAETDKLREDIKLASSEKVTLTRLLEEAREETKLSAKRAVLIGKDLNTARTSLEELNEKCEELKQAFEEDRDRWMEEKHQTAEKLCEQEKNAANAISLRNKELLELRNLSQTYVNERSDCEAFLISCLEDVRVKKNKENVETSKTYEEQEQEENNNNDEAALVVVEEYGESDDYVHVSAPGPIDFTKLSWQEKETILFNLFRALETSVVNT